MLKHNQLIASYKQEVKRRLPVDCELCFDGSTDLSLVVFDLIPGSADCKGERLWLCIDCINQIGQPDVCSIEIEPTYNSGPAFVLTG